MVNPLQVFTLREDDEEEVYRDCNKTAKCEAYADQVDQACFTLSNIAIEGMIFFLFFFF